MKNLKIQDFLTNAISETTKLEALTGGRSYDTGCPTGCSEERNDRTYQDYVYDKGMAGEHYTEYQDGNLPSCD